MEFATIIFNLLYSMFWAGGVTFVVILIVDGVIMTLKKNKAIREARDAGHEIIAKRVDFKSQRGQSRNKIIGYYEYRYDNKTYKYKNTFYQYPPEEITLYFKNKPEKAKTEDSFGGAESGYGTVFFGVTILMFILRLV